MTIPPPNNINALVELFKVYVSPRSVSRSKYYAWKSICGLWPSLDIIAPPSIVLARTLLSLLIKIK